MKNDDVTALLDAEDRALAVHEAGHAVVARALGAEVAFIEIDLGTGNGSSRSGDFADQIKNLAVCVAGCRAEHVLKEPALGRKAKESDRKKMRKILSSLPEAERRAARAEGYRRAEAILMGNANVVRRIAHELRTRNGRIEGDELSALLSLVRLNHETPCG
jgi:hypothetical protein